MKRQLFHLSLVVGFALLTFCSKEIPREELEVKNGIAFKKGESTAYTGKVVSFYENGKQKEETSFRKGKKEGPFTNWNEYGLPKLQGEWLNGKKNGMWTEYYDIGKKQFEGAYTDDEESGLWTHFDRTGKPDFTFDYPEHCKKLSGQEINELLLKIKNTPLEPVSKDEVAVLETNFGKMVVELFPAEAPKHSAAFKRLVNTGFYDCTTFHRVIDTFMIQGGDIATRYAGRDRGPDGPGYTLEAEFNDIPHEKGILSMARSMTPNSAGSQFFICLSRERTEHLDGKYTVFGRLIEGMDVLERIGSFKVKNSPVYNASVLPVHPVIIKKATMQVRS
jgi:cyclophilin family peptidyl-prolyl cis-trans isomerase